MVVPVLALGRCVRCGLLLLYWMYSAPAVGNECFCSGCVLLLWLEMPVLALGRWLSGPFILSVDLLLIFRSVLCLLSLYRFEDFLLLPLALSVVLSCC